MTSASSGRRLIKSPNPSGVLERPERRRQEVLVGVAGREDEPPQPLGVVRGDELAEGAAGIVADQGYAIEVEGLHEVGDQPGDAEGGEVGDGLHRRPMGAEREVGHDAAEVPLEQRRDLAPQRAVDEQPVGEDDRLPGARVAIADHPLGELDLLRRRLELSHLVLAWHVTPSRRLYSTSLRVFLTSHKSPAVRALAVEGHTRKSQRIGQGLARAEPNPDWRGDEYG